MNTHEYTKSWRFHPYKLSGITMVLSTRLPKVPEGHSRARIHGLIDRLDENDEIDTSRIQRLPNELNTNPKENNW